MLPRIAWVVLACSSLPWTSAEAYIPSPRAYNGCAVLLNKLYCYGGGSLDTYGAVKPVNDHVYIDLSVSFSIAKASSTWQEVPNPSGFKLEPNAMFASTQLSDTSYMITSGIGYNDAQNTSLVNLTTVFHADTNQWESIPGRPFNQTEGSSLSIDSENVAWLWGGKQSLTQFTAPPSDMYRYLPSANQWTSLELPMPSDVKSGSAFHAAAVAQNKIYLIGGEALGYVSMENILVFDTVGQNWALIKIPNTISPPREKATLTYLPATNQLLFYGGLYVMYNTAYVVSDKYCWIYDINTNTWSSKNVTSNVGAGPRYGHSATLYRERYLLIAFGYNSNNSVQSDLHVLDTQTWQWLSTWDPILASSGSGSSTPGSSSMSEESTGLSGGAIAGIAVGAAALVIGVALAAFWFIRKRKNEEKQTNDRPEDDGFMYSGKKKEYASLSQLGEQSPPPIYDVRAPVPIHGITKPHEADEANKPDSPEDKSVSKPDDTASAANRILQPITSVKPDDATLIDAPTGLR